MTSAWRGRLRTEARRPRVRDDLGQGRAMLDPTPSPEARRSTPEARREAVLGHRTRPTEGRGRSRSRWWSTGNPSPRARRGRRPAHDIRSGQVERSSWVACGSTRRRTPNPIFVTVAAADPGVEGLGRLVPEGHRSVLVAEVPGHPPRREGGARRLTTSRVPSQDPRGVGPGLSRWPWAGANLPPPA